MFFYPFEENSIARYKNIIPLDAHMRLEETKERIDCYNISMWNDTLKSFDGGRITVAGDFAIPAAIGMTFDPFDLLKSRKNDREQAYLITYLSILGGKWA